MTIGQGAMQSVSRKHKLNIRIITEAELVAVDCESVYILWDVLFIECQGYNIDKKILYQDNKSSIIMDINVKMSVGKKLLALDILYFL